MSGNFSIIKRSKTLNGIKILYDVSNNNDRRSSKLF